MAESAVADKILADTQIPGLDIAEAMGRLGNSSKLYMRIIHSFVTNMPHHLDELNAPSAETLGDYAIKVHGVKGSCYGIGANRCGNAAKGLEIAAKAGDLCKVLRDNGAFLVEARALLVELEKLEATVTAAEVAATSASLADSPDPVILQALLEATQDFDIEQMQKLIDELDSVSYRGSDLVAFIKERFGEFDYQAIEDRINAIL